MLRTAPTDTSVSPGNVCLLVRIHFTDYCVLSETAEQHTVALDGDTLAAGAFLSQADCAAGGAGGLRPRNAGCIMDSRMAGQLVSWFAQSKSGAEQMNAFTQLRPLQLHTLTEVPARFPGGRTSLAGE
eukprot:1030245-Rhodomonas_salina.6